jgi:DNA excision repair protein ERCC-4
MCNSERTATLIRDYLSMVDQNAPRGHKGRKIMERRLRSYLFWKGRLTDSGGKSQREVGLSVSAPKTLVTDDQPSEALRRKDALKKERQGSRRRVRGAPPGGAPSERTQEPEARAGAMGGESVVQHEAQQLAEL